MKTIKTAAALAALMLGTQAARATPPDGPYSEEVTGLVGCDWGADAQAKVGAVFTQVAEAAGFTPYFAPGASPAIPPGAPALSVIMEFDDSKGDNPGTTFPPRTPDNPGVYPLIKIHPSILEIACREDATPDPDAAACIVSHEMSHAVQETDKGKEAFLKAKRQAYIKSCLKKLPPEMAGAKPGEQLAFCAAWTAPASDRTREQDADDEGLTLAALAGYDPAGCARADDRMLTLAVARRHYTGFERDTTHPKMEFREWTSEELLEKIRDAGQSLSSQ